MSKPLQAVVLVGGLGTRLGSLTADTPKPMLEIGGKPFLEYLVLLLRRNQVRRILFCVGHLSEVIRNYFDGGQRFGLQIDYNQEPRPSGTGGALLLAAHKLEDVFFVLNGDTLFDIPLANLQNTIAEGNASGVLALRLMDDVRRFGTVDFNGRDIVAFAENGSGRQRLINGGIYCLKKSSIAELSHLPCSLERDLFPKLASNGRLRGERFESYFVDIGVPEDLSRARVEFPARFRSLF